MLLGGEQGAVYPAAQPKTEQPAKPFELPPVNRDMRRAYAYLVKHRKIDRDIISVFAKEKLIYEDSEYHNAVFVGLDENGMARHAHKRSVNSFGKTFRINVESSDPRYSFHRIGTDDSLYVFEAPIDLLSYITLHPDHWQEHSYVSCCGTSSQPVLKMLELYPKLRTVNLCLDNDSAGEKASLRIAEQVAERFGIVCNRLTSQLKDWNDDLVQNAEENKLKEVNCVCPTFG